MASARDLKVNEPGLSVDHLATHFAITKDAVMRGSRHAARPLINRAALEFQASEVDEWMRSGGATTPECGAMGHQWN